MSKRLRNLGGFAGVLSVYGVATLPILLTFPAIWPDEVLFHSPAAALARGEGFGTSVLAGFIPGIERYTYWQPPGYFVFLSLVLRWVAPAHHLVAMRLSSWFLGVAVLLLGAGVLKRLSRYWGMALLGLVALGTQVSFIQTSNAGRMEMLTLACMMAAISCYLGYRENHSRYSLAAASFLAGLAIVCHPAGILAAFVMVVHELAMPGARKSTGRDALVFAGCLTAALVPWLAYIAEAPRLFLEQMLAQSARKTLVLSLLSSSRHYRHWLLSPFESAAWPLQHRLLGLWPFRVGSGGVVLIVVFCAGLAALLAEGRRRVEASLLGAWALAGYAVNLFLPEAWYAVHLTVPCCLLLGWAAADSSRKWIRAVALAVLVAASVWNLAVDRVIWRASRDAWPMYKLYCSSLAQMIPANSAVLLAAIPDPYFGWLALNRSYRIYEFVPEGVPVNRAQAQRMLDRVDYVVGSECCRPAYLVNYLNAHGEFQANMGTRDFLSPPVLVWKLSNRLSPSIRRDEGTGNAK
jgi:hypothetical protein